MILPTTANAVSPVQKVIAVDEGRRVLINRDRDGLDVLEKVSFTRCLPAQLGERIEPGRIVRLFLAPFAAARPSPTPTAKHTRFRRLCSFLAFHRSAIVHHGVGPRTPILKPAKETAAKRPAARQRKSA